MIKNVKFACKIISISHEGSHTGLVILFLVNATDSFKINIGARLGKSRACSTQIKKIKWELLFFFHDEERMVLQTGSCMFNRLEMVPVETWGLVCSCSWILIFLVIFKLENPSCRCRWDVHSIVPSFSPSFSPTLPARSFGSESADQYMRFSQS